MTKGYLDMAKGFLELLRTGLILFDGATGTMLQRLGLKGGGCPDELNIKEPSIVRKVHSAYREAGSAVVTTNTFGANRVKLREYSLEGRVREINMAGAEIARSCGDGLVAGCIGPTGRFVEPVGDMDFDEAVDIFREQAEALKEGGVDLFIIETMMDIKEMRAAVVAVKEEGLPVIVTMTFEDTMRSMLGTPPDVFAIVAEALGVDCVGVNCSLGVEGIYKAISIMSSKTRLPLIAQPNAGIPVLKDGRTVFPSTPQEMASFVPKLVEKGVRVVGGCCGTTPEHIKEMGDALRRCKPSVTAGYGDGVTGLASRTDYILFGGGLRPVVIGERINPTGRKLLAQEIREGRTSLIRKEAKEQAKNGAHALDVNVGLPDVDEPGVMKRAIFAINENTALPVVIDSSNNTAIEAGLKAVDGKALVNSVSGEERRLSGLLPIVRKYGGAVIGLTLDEKGIPEDAEGRVRVAERIVKRATDMGIRKEDVIIDCLAMTVSTDERSAIETLKAIRLVKRHLNVPTILGISNVSFGLPQRTRINSAFLAMAIEAGLDCAIINPNNEMVMDMYYSSLVLTGKDARAGSYIKRFKKEPSRETEEREVRKEEVKDIGERIKNAVVEGDEENIVGLVEQALGEGWDPLRISNEALIPGLERVGELFASNVYFLPQVILSAGTMKRAFDRLKREFKGRRGPLLGKVLMATVEGDIHDIGKNIVITLLENHGFEVIDLGKNVPAQRIVEEAERYDVDVVGLSALMTTTVMEMDNVIKRLKERKIRAKTVVGGAVVTEEFAKRIGADEYGGEAVEAVEKIKRLMGVGSSLR